MNKNGHIGMGREYSELKLHIMNTRNSNVQQIKFLAIFSKYRAKN